MNDDEPLRCDEEFPRPYTKRIEVIETNLLLRGDGAKDSPRRRVTQYWSDDGTLLAERDDKAPTHCNGIGHRVMHGADGCSHCGATLAQMIRAVRLP